MEVASTRPHTSMRQRDIVETRGQPLDKEEECASLTSVDTSFQPRPLANARLGRHRLLPRAMPRQAGPLVKVVTRRTRARFSRITFDSAWMRSINVGGLRVATWRRRASGA